LQILALTLEYLALTFYQYHNLQAEVYGLKQLDPDVDLRIIISMSSIKPVPGSRYNDMLYPWKLQSQKDTT
jgi:hypothetical protein